MNQEEYNKTMTIRKATEKMWASNLDTLAQDWIIEQLTAQAETIAKLREALELIANKKHWVNVNGELVWNELVGNEFFTQHASDIARAILAETESK